jgi:hypothetical protein
VRVNLAKPGQRVRGIAVVKRASDLLKLTLRQHPEFDIELFEYDDDGNVHKVPLDP